VTARCQFPRVFSPVSIECVVQLQWSLECWQSAHAHAQRRRSVSDSRNTVPDRCRNAACCSPHDRPACPLSAQSWLLPGRRPGALWLLCRRWCRSVGVRHQCNLLWTCDAAAASSAISPHTVVQPGTADVYPRACVCLCSVVHWVCIRMCTRVRECVLSQCVYSCVCLHGRMETHTETGTVLMGMLWRAPALSWACVSFVNMFCVHRHRVGDRRCDRARREDVATRNIA
jgi:hypothetical protein